MRKGQQFIDKIKLNNIIKKISDFFTSDCFILLITAMVYVFWTTKKDAIGIWFFMCLAFFSLALVKNSAPLLTVILLFTYSLRTINTIDKGSSLFFALIPLVLGIIAHLIRFRPKNKPSKQVKPLIVVCLALVLGGVGYKTNYSYTWIIIPSLAILIIAVYAFFNATIDFEGERLAMYICKILSFVGILMFLQCATYYFEMRDILVDILIDKRLNFGWGISNNMGAVLCLTIPATMYLSTLKSKVSPLYFVLAIIQYVTMIFTLSRGALLGMTIALPFLLCITIKKTPYKKTYCSIFAALTVVGVSVVLIKMDTIGKGLATMLEKGFDDSGRFEIYAEAWECFKRHPIFGVGFDYRTGQMTSSPIYWFHSTLMETIGKMGLLGLIGIAWLVGQRYANAFKAKSLAGYGLIASCMVFEFYGMLDTNFFHPIQFFTLLMICMALERIVAEKPIIIPKAYPYNALAGKNEGEEAEAESIAAEAKALASETEKA